MQPRRPNLHCPARSIHVCTSSPLMGPQRPSTKRRRHFCTWTPYLARSAAQHSPPSPAPITTTSVECERASGAVGSVLLGRPLLSGAATAGAADALAGLARGRLPLHLRHTPGHSAFLLCKRLLVLPEVITLCAVWPAMPGTSCAGAAAARAPACLASLSPLTPLYCAQTDGTLQQLCQGSACNGYKVWGRPAFRKISLMLRPNMQGARKTSSLTYLLASAANVAPG